MQDAIERVAAALRNAQSRPEKCTLLIGAGCSITAGIKSAAGIVADIRDSRGKANDLSYYYDRALERAKQRNTALLVPEYGDCMAVLPPGPQRDLLRGYIDRAKLNWAHVGIGALVANGYVDRILTTNFDPLISRGCAVFHEFPAVYDLTMSPKLKLGDLPDKAMFHLHGQRNGFALLNSDTELQEHKQHLKPLFDHARSNRTWIVCGYSGENDPLMDFIVEHERYDYELFWIDIKDDAPTRLRPLTDRCEQSFCRYYRFPGADQFFIRLANQLGLFPFRFMNRPLDHLRALIDTFTEFPVDATDEGLDLFKDARQLLDRYEQAMDSLSKSADQTAAEQIAGLGDARMHTVEASALGKSSTLSNQMRALMAFIEGNQAYLHAEEATSQEDALSRLREACEHYRNSLTHQMDNHDALNNWGAALNAQAQRSPDADAHRLWAEAGEKFAAALAIKPDLHEALNNWGAAFAAQARRSPDADAHRLWAEAGQKYAAALAIKPDQHEALNNWGTALAAQAQRSPDADTHRLWAEAGQKYAAALAIKPDLHETLNNWGVALDTQAQRSPDPDAHRLWAEAGDKFAAALAIKPDLHDALNNWGNALAAQAQRSPDADAHRLWAEAGEKYAAALAIKPDLHDALNNWGIALATQAQRSPDADAHRIWAEAGDKFAAALANKPDKHEALNNWGIALLTQAHSSNGEKRKSLLRQAEDKLTQSETIAPGSAAYNLACVYAMRAALPQMVEWLDRSEAAGKLPTREHIAKDRDFEAVRDTPEFKAWLAKMGWTD